MNKKIRSRSHSVGLLVSSLMMAGHTLAQTPPDAGQVFRDLQRVPQPGATGKAAPLSVPAEAGPAAVPGESFFVRSVRIEGVTEIALAELLPLVDELENSQRSLADLQNAARRITAHYRAKGYIVARAFIPPQEIRDGAVTIQVLEGRLNRSAVQNDSALATDALEETLQAQRLTEGVIQASKIDRAMLLLADLPGVGPVSGNLRPGDAVGTSDLMVDVGPGKRVDGELALDNFGNRYTGEKRLNGRLDVLSPLGIGDRLAIRGTVTDESLLFGRVAYDRPWGGDGVRVGAAYSSSRYELGREFALLDAQGTAKALSAYVSYPAIRSLRNNVSIAASVEHRKLRDELRFVGSSTEKTANVLLVESYGDFNDDIGFSGAVSNWRIGLSAGSLDIRTPAAQVADTAGPRTAGSFQKLQMSFNRLQSIGAQTTGLVSLTTQFASKNLDSSEKFAIGGVYGVRAYPQGEGVGDEGLLLNLEIRQRLTSNLQATAFYDHGHVRYNVDTFAPGGNQLTLRGYGLGLRAEWDNVNLSTFVAWRGTDRAKTAPEKSPRLWVSAGVRF